MMKRLFLLIGFAFSVFIYGAAQNPAAQSEPIESQLSLDTSLKDSPFSLSLELASRYIWRGLEYGDAPVSFATMSYGYKGFSVWAMGAYALNGSHQEVDLGLTYTFDWATLGLSDYYYPSAVGENDRYFDLDNKTTGHWGELYATLMPFKVPLWLTASCYIYGADKNPDGKQAYSSYAELGYSYNFKNDNAVSLAVGAALNKSFYNNFETGFSVVNITLKYSTAFKFGSFRLPVSGSYVINPQKEKSYFTFSVYFNI